jgi:PA domain
MRTAKLLSAFALLCLLAVAPAFGAATITIVNTDGPGEGFNDPGAADPDSTAGGNPGATIGEQRLIAFQYAADVWGAFLESDVEIFIQASFDPLGPPAFPACTTGGVLGAAGTIQIFSDFPGAELANTWYHGALANKLAGGDLSPGPNGTNSDDLVAFFNSDLDNPVCLGSRGWYYGLDTNHGVDINLVSVLLHELGHGLGFANFANEATGTLSSGRGDIFSEYTLDITTGKTWNQMTNAERQASAINARKVVWNGINVTAAIPGELALGTPLVRVNTPAALGKLEVGPALFGPALTSPGVTGALVQALDASTVDGPSTTDGCTPLTNAVAVSGNIALVDRGTCGFTVKVKNAQDAGAIAVVVADNAPGGPPANLGGADPTITIPSGRVTLADGTALKAALPNVNLTLGLDPTVRAGTEPSTGKVHLNAPNPVQPGSSISHWDPIASPNLLMEPSISADLPLELDLTEEEMVDIGWFSDGDGVPDGRDSCIGSNPSATVVIESCSTSAPNVINAAGCKFTDKVEACAARYPRPAQFVACVTVEAARQKQARAFTLRQTAEVVTCAVLSQLH